MDLEYFCDDGIFEYELVLAMQNASHKEIRMEVQQENQNIDNEMMVKCEETLICLDSNVVGLFKQENIMTLNNSKIDKIKLISNLSDSAPVRRIDSLKNHLLHTDIIN